MPQGPPPAAQLSNADHSRALSAFAVCGIVVALAPGALIGAAIAAGLWRVTKTEPFSRWFQAGICAVAAVLLHADLFSAWPLRLLPAFAPASGSGVSLDSILAALPAEVLLGPLVLLAFGLGAQYRSVTIHGLEWKRHSMAQRRRKALEKGWAGPGGNVASPGDFDHPPGFVRLGSSGDTEQPFDIGTDELAQHIFVPGASGTGKTTTLVRLADGALESGYGVVMVDCKGVGLGGEARAIAKLHGVPFTTVDAQDPKSKGYDPCSGDAAAIANKLIGAFTFTGEAEIYKQVAMEIIPIICRAMAASGTTITLDGIYNALGPGGLSELGRRPGADEFRDRLADLERSGGVAMAGYIGFQKRLGALMEGTFGEIFRKRPALDWDKQLARPAVTYLSLSSMAAGEDVELFGRLITQDLKQVCDSRMRAIDRGKNPVPVLIIYDEFASLREATQIVDLLLQARQARAPLVVATQYLPLEPAIRKPVLSAGVLLCHRLEAEDADLIAAQFGTHTTSNMTAQVDFDEGTSRKGSVRYVEEYNVHPNQLKSLPVGMVAVYARRTGRRELVRVHKTL